MLIFVIYFLATSSEKVSSNMYKMHRFRLYRAKSPPGTCSLYIHSIVSNDSVKDSKGRDQTAQMRSLISACPHMPKDTFSHDVALLILTAQASETS